MKKFNLLKRILPCLLIIVTVFALASCKGCKKGETSGYPSVTPSIDKPNDAYLTIGNYKVTNESVYTRLLLNYGLETLLKMINEEVINYKDYDINNPDADFEKELEEIIYGDLTDETEKAEALEAFEKDMRSIGLFTTKDYKNYYKFSYDKNKYVINEFKKFVEEYDKENDEKYFTEEEMKDYYEQTNLPKVSAIVITFDSYNNALEVMKKYGININTSAEFNDKEEANPTINGNWSINGEAANKESLKDVFTKMYNEVNGTTEVVELDNEGLTKLSATISSKVHNLESVDSEEISKSYTHAPQLFGSRYYLALKTVENYEGITKFEDLNETEKEDLLIKLIETEINSNYTSKVFAEAITDFKIYDEGLETRYIQQLTTVYKNLNIESEMPYTATTDEDAKVVARFKVNGQEKTITAQDLFKELVGQYGSALTFALLQQYAVLYNTDYNKVYDLANGKVLNNNQIKYDSFYKSDVSDIKTSFEAGKYAENGFPASYGWNNFLRDYLGVKSENELLGSLNGSLFNEAQSILAETIWLKPASDDENAVLDELVQAEMTKIFDNYFNASIIGLYAYYDKDNDNVGDEYGMEIDTDSLSEDLLTTAYNEAYKIVEKDQYLNKTLLTALTEVVSQYNLSSSTTEGSKWQPYKKAGLRLFVMSTVTYTSTSAINEDLSTEIKTLWDKVVAFKDTEKGADITGKTLDPSYRYTYEDEDKVKHAASVSAQDFTSDIFFTNNADEESKSCNIAYRISLTKATAATYITNTDKEVRYAPTYQEYVQYLADKKSTAVSKAIEAYYIPAINNIVGKTGSNTMGSETLNKILDMVKSYLNDATISSSANKANIEQLIADSYTEKE